MKFGSSKGGPLDLQKNKIKRKKTQEVNRLRIRLRKIKQDRPIDSEFDAESIPHIRFARKNLFNVEMA